MQLLGATLEAFCSEDNVMKMLAGKISPYQIIAKRRNPNLQLGQPVFDKFVQSMEGIATGCANLSPSNLVDGQTQASGLPLPLQLAFHGTPPENINSIFKEGMRSSQHRFGCHASISRSYVTPSRMGPRGPVWKLLLFVLLMVRTVISSRSDSVVVMTSAHHELPVYEITFQAQHGMRAVRANSTTNKKSTTSQEMATQKERSSSNGSPGTTPTPPPASGLQTEEGTATRPRASSSKTPAKKVAVFDPDMMEKLFSFMSFYEQHQQGAPAQSNNSNNNATPMSLDGSSYARGN
ncbi:unnamed protein product [Closterium sp. NIES-53]